ncbi:MAG TPA: hypothetical protein VGU01_15475 [Sphingomicrobium sp.]|nr:hypothetical protein [Sphingomicrobium sp.]
MPKVSISQAWDETRAVLVRDGRLIASVALALIVLPGVVLNVLVPNGVTVGTGQQAAWVALGLLVLLLTFIGQLSVLRLAMGPHIAVGEAIRHASFRVLPFLGAFVLWVVPFLVLGSVPYTIIRSHPADASTAAGIGLLAVMAAAMFLAIRLLLIGPVASAEPGGSLKIIRRSWELTEGNWWRLFGFVLMFAIGAMVLILAVSNGLGLVARLTIGPVTPLSVAGLVLVLIAQLLTAGIYVVLFVMQARIYQQLAGTHEGRTGLLR